MHIDALPDHRKNLARWSELSTNPELARLPYRIETDRLGRIIMSPPPFFSHTWRVAKILEFFRGQLPEGKVLVEVACSTSDGVKVIDAAWISAEYEREFAAAQDLPPALVRAPEICIEVLSPSNTTEEMEEKRALYFEAGAEEVWICELDGEMKFYVAGTISNVSKLCPNFPSRID